jgi:hypothetical protein
MAVNASSAQAEAAGYVVGVNTGDGQVYPRLEIDDFVQDNDVLNLFLIALTQLQDEKISDQPFSWFQISGAS